MQYEEYGPDWLSTDAAREPMIRSRSKSIYLRNLCSFTTSRFSFDNNHRIIGISIFKDIQKLKNRQRSSCSQKIEIPPWKWFSIEWIEFRLKYLLFHRFRRWGFSITMMTARSWSTPLHNKYLKDYITLWRWWCGINKQILFPEYTRSPVPRKKRGKEVIDTKPHISKESFWCEINHYLSIV